MIAPAVPNFFLGCLDSAACDKGRYQGTWVPPHLVTRRHVQKAV